MVIRWLKHNPICCRHARRGVLFAAWLHVAGLVGATPVQVGSRLELFVDRHLIEELTGAELRMGSPRREEVSLRFDRPWEGPWAGALSVFKDGDVYRMYYRGAFPDENGENTAECEMTCYAESRDGIHWTKPNLGLHEFNGSKENNIVLPPGSPVRASHNFAPFRDGRPGVPADERYKAVGGTYWEGLYRFCSPDGIHWRMFSEEPLFLGYALDTLNQVIWSPAEKVYVAYIRTWTAGGTPDYEDPSDFAGYRTISRSVSTDFVTWTKPEPMTFGCSPMEHLYTIGARPYFRAPHIIIAFPFRFVPGRQVLSDEEIKLSGKGTSDVVLLSSRGGREFDRTFLESFIRPGLQREAWVARSNIPSPGVVPMDETSMSMYVAVGYTTPDYHLRRYSLRTDGFASVNAPFAGGEMRTWPLVFDGRRLVINYSTSSIGHVRVALLDPRGRSLPGFSLEDCDEIVGDHIARVVTWNGKSDVSSFAGRPVRLHFQMKDADLYSLQFTTGLAE